MNERATIRLGAIEDLADIRACVAAAYAPYIEIIGKEPAAMRTDFTPYLTAGQVFVATSEAGELVGLMVTIADDACFELRSMAVLPSLQRRGIGRRLIAHAEEQARALGYDTLRLYTNAKLGHLIAMYHRMGFTERERKHDGGYDRVFMMKAL